jgi:hypothetical protein
VPYLLNVESRKAIPLMPLFFWSQIEGHHAHEHGHCFAFDLPERDGITFSYKALGIPHAEKVSSSHRLSRLAAELTNLRMEDGQLNAIELSHIELMEE